MFGLSLSIDLLDLVQGELWSALATAGTYVPAGCEVWDGGMVEKRTATVNGNPCGGHRCWYMIYDYIYVYIYINI